MKVSIVVTVLNEEESIIRLLESIFYQTKKPDEVVIVDGGSKDKTVRLIKEFKNIRLVELKGANRPRGRNVGIKMTKNEIIAITDGGCVLDKNWLEEIISPFKDPKVEIVSGYYRVQAKSVFGKCVGVYTLVMPDRINTREFLPSTRSMAFRKNVWKEAGGFPEKFSLNEDYVFAQILKKTGKKFYFTKRAIVYWKPRENLKKAFLMFYYFAKGDAQASVLRLKVILIFIRYFIGATLFVYAFKHPGLFAICYLLVASYILWAIFKNYKYVKHWQAAFFLPLLQFTSDIAIIIGTIRGIIGKNEKS